MDVRPKVTGTFQKKSNRAAEQDRRDVRRARRDWIECQEEVDAWRLVFLDETSLKTTLTRLRGWAFGGNRIVEAVPAGHWKTSTLVQAISLDGTRAAMVLDGAINGPSFTGFCDWLLACQLRQKDLVVMDNLSSHKSQAAVDIIESTGADVIYLPPYSPDLNPIEQVFSKLKQLIRARKPRAFTEIIDATAEAIPRITPSDIEACFTHCGYITT